MAPRSTSCPAVTINNVNRICHTTLKPAHCPLLLSFVGRLQLPPPFAISRDCQENCSQRLASTCWTVNQLIS